MHCLLFFTQRSYKYPCTGADPGFQVRGGGAFKPLRRAEGGAKIVGVFRVKNHDFTPKNHIFSNFRGGARRACPPPGSTPAEYKTIRGIISISVYKTMTTKIN